MNVLIIADMHFDLWAGQKINPLDMAPAGTFDDLDALVIAGDLANKPKTRWRPALRELAKHVPADRIHVIPGNHDYYDHVLDGDDRLRDLAQAEGANFAQKSVIHVGDARFICCTLWTDFAVDGHAGADMWSAEKNMNDYAYIRMANRGYSKIRALDIAAVHQQHKEWIIERLKEPWPGLTYVVTHHCPDPDLLGKQREYAPAYASDLRPIISKYQPDGWFFGHTHERLESRIGNTVISNISIGYPNELEIDDIFPDRLILDRSASPDPA